jgi:hypothetical protein
MKKLLAATFISLFALSSSVYAADEKKKEPETKKVCVKQKDSKSGKEKDVCKNVKVHKKLEGTKVPEKK